MKITNNGNKKYQFKFFIQTVNNKSINKIGPHRPLILALGFDLHIFWNAAP